MMSVKHGGIRIAAMLHPSLSSAIWRHAADLAPALTASLVEDDAGTH